MSAALRKASPLRPEIRLAQAVSEFEAALSHEQKNRFRTERSKMATEPPGPYDVMRLTAEFDRQISKKYNSQCFGPRFTYFLQGVQQFAALGDVVVGGSQNLLACGVWSLVRMTILSFINISAYVDKLSSLFMEIGRSAPRHEAMALLYPRAPKLQSYLAEYFVVVIRLCHHVFQFGRRSIIQQFTTALSDAKLQAFRNELDGWAVLIKEEMHLHDTQDNSRFRALSRKIFKDSSHEQKMARTLRILDFCSTYNYQTTWKQTRKAGNATFFLQIPEYQEWKDSSSSSTLICTGTLGSGKSVMLANIVDDINLCAKKGEHILAYFFCTRDVAESLQARTIFGSLARQILCTLPNLTELVQSEDIMRRTGNFDEVLDLLVKVFPSDHKLFIILDGLDGCNEMDKEAILEGLSRIQEAKNVFICASFRAEPNNSLPLVVRNLATCRVLCMPDDNPDIKNFIEMSLESCLRQEKLVIGDPTLILEIQDALLIGSQGMFLWVALQIRSLCSMKTDQAIREALADLPRDLSETFRCILYEAGSADRSLQSKVLRLVVAASRPLTTDELREALSVTPGDTVWNSSKVLNEVRSALACCGCLLIVDEEELTVRVVHHSVSQFILSTARCPSDLHFSFADAERTMADIVVTYLGYAVFETQIVKRDIQPVMAQSAPSRIIGTAFEPSSATRHIALKLLNLNSRRETTFDMSKIMAEARATFGAKPENPFKFFAYAKSYWQDHILYASGQEETILNLSLKVLRERTSELELVSEDHWNHCCWAMKNQNREILVVFVEVFLEAGKIDVTDKNVDGRTPLIWAVRNGCIDIVKLLLSHPETCLARYNTARETTPLCWAVIRGHKDIVELLLNTGQVDVDGGLGYVCAPLIWAVRGNKLDIIRILLDIGKANVEVKDIGRFSALTVAAREGHTEAARLLLKNTMVNLEAQSTPSNYTPLMWAIQRRHFDVIRLLLETKRVDVNAKGSKGETPMTLAIQHKGIVAVQMLLGTGKVEMNAKSPAGLTPLMLAIQERHMDGVQILLSSGLVDVNATDPGGRTPLMLAIEGRDEVAVRLLLETGKVDIHAQDLEKRTSLIWAVTVGDYNIINMLFNSKDIDVGRMVDEEQVIAVIWAESNGRKDISRLIKNRIRKFHERPAPEAEILDLVDGTKAAEFGRSTNKRLEEIRSDIC